MRQSTRSSRRTSRQIESGAVDGVLSLVLTAPQRKPTPSLPRRLESLFRELGKRSPSLPADDIEDLIWSLWISHDSDEAMGDMAAATEAMAAGALDLARLILDRIIETHPEWAEAWNKRATLSFMEKRDEECLADIKHTLTLEPRHFGAILGFGQVCLRQGALREARAAFQIALEINPHLEGMREVVDELGQTHQVFH